jgi:hypothetical protein
MPGERGLQRRVLLAQQHAEVPPVTGDLVDHLAPQGGRQRRGYPTRQLPPQALHPLLLDRVGQLPGLHRQQVALLDQVIQQQLLGTEGLALAGHRIALAVAIGQFAELGNARLQAFALGAEHAHGQVGLALGLQGPFAQGPQGFARFDVAHRAADLLQLLADLLQLATRIGGHRLGRAGGGEGGGGSQAAQRKTQQENA